MFVALAAEVIVRETGDVVSMLRDYEGNSDVRIGVYRAISSAPGAVDLSSVDTLSALRDQFAREGDPNCLPALLDAARAVPEVRDEEAKRLWFEASILLLERLGGSLGEEERAACFELCGRFYSPSIDNGVNVR